MGSQHPLAALAVEGLRVGSVIYKHCDFTTPAKHKYLVVAALEPKLYILLVNSKINEFYKANGLDKYHVRIPASSDHDFLEHNSFIDCTSAYGNFQLERIRNELSSNYTEIHKGWISDSILRTVHSAVSQQPVMRIGIKNIVLAALKKQIG